MPQLIASKWHRSTTSRKLARLSTLRCAITPSTKRRESIIRGALDKKIEFKTDFYWLHSSLHCSSLDVTSKSLITILSGSTPFGHLPLCLEPSVAPASFFLFSRFSRASPSRYFFQSVNVLNTKQYRRLSYSMTSTSSSPQPIMCCAILMTFT